MAGDRAEDARRFCAEGAVQGEFHEEVVKAEYPAFEGQLTTFGRLGERAKIHVAQSCD